MLKKLFYRDNNKIHWLHGYEEKPEILFGSDNRFTIKNFRNAAMIDNTLCFDWQDKTLNLDDISSVDLVISYWSSRHIAHVFLSFGFGSGEYVAISIETRRQASQKYSTWKGFFNTYELIYVVADERDLIGIRANVRKEDVYIYRVNVTKEVCKQVFLDYALRINSLKNNDEFYHTINNNCTTNILRRRRRRRRRGRAGSGGSSPRPSRRGTPRRRARGRRRWPPPTCARCARRRRRSR